MLKRGETRRVASQKDHITIYGNRIDEKIFAFNPIMLEIAHRTTFHIKNRVHAEVKS
jgi:hypothetical protein